MGGEYGNTLQVASFGGNDTIAELLLGNRAEVNVKVVEYVKAMRQLSLGKMEKLCKSC